MLPAGGEGDSHYAIHLEHSVFLNKAYLQGNCFTSKNWVEQRFYGPLTNLREGSTYTRPQPGLPVSPGSGKDKSICEEAAFVKVTAWEARLAKRLRLSNWTIDPFSPLTPYATSVGFLYCSRSRQQKEPHVSYLT